MKLLWFLTVVVGLATAATINAQTPAESQKVRYDNYSVFKLNITNKAQLEVLRIIKSQSDKFNIWKDYDEVEKEVHIMVKPEEAEHFSRLTKSFDLKMELLIPNVQELIDAEQETFERSDDASFGWTRYYKLHDIEAWLDGILANYSQVAERFTIGQSYEGRSIHGIKISYKSGNPGVFIESNIHAREWITSATATWFINQLLTSENAEIRNLAENIDWYILPVFNVDGFVYSHERDRMWRKTRQPLANTPCIGTDGNRNFDSHWMENGGASSGPCDETYGGPEPFSEPEMLALADYVAIIKDKINIYLSFHSYGQYLLSPYGHTAEEVPENHQDIIDIGNAFSTAIENLSYGTKYAVGTTAQILYVASGSSVDWVFNTQGVKLGYTIEYRDKGRYGFVLPPVQILPNCEELMTGMLAFINKSRELGYLRK